MGRIHGVLVTYNRRDHLERTMRRLASQSRLLDRLIVIDNGDDPEVQALVESVRAAGTVDYVSPGSNLGPAGGFALGMRRLAAAESEDDWIFLFDDDDPPLFDDELEHAMDFADGVLARDPTVGGVGAGGGRFDMKRGEIVRIGDSELSGPVRVDHITGGALPAYKITAVRAVGPMLEDLFFGFEELEYGQRLGESGFSLYADGDQWKKRRTLKRSEGSMPMESVPAGGRLPKRLSLPGRSWRRYYSMRNLIYILRRHGRRGTAMRVSLVRGILKPGLHLLRSPREARTQLAVNLRAISDGWRGNLGHRHDPDVGSAPDCGPGPQNV